MVVHLEILPDNIPYIKGSAKILKQFRNVGEETDVMAEARAPGKAIKERLMQQPRS